MENENDELTPKEVSELLGISRNLVYYLLKNKELKHRVWGRNGPKRKKLIKRKWVTEYLESKTIQPVQAVNEISIELEN